MHKTALWTFIAICIPFSRNLFLYFLQLAGLWEEKLKEEQVKTGPLEEVCAALREALDAEHKKRMDVFETKMKPIIIKDGPSKKVSIIFGVYTLLLIYLPDLI